MNMCKVILSNFPQLSQVTHRILTRLVKHVFNYLRDNNIIYKYQSGFLPGHSTTHHLVHLYHVIADAFDKQKKVRLVFGDISKAFDKVWHRGLIYKLKRIGVRGSVGAWMANYLDNRQQRVVLPGASSSWKNTNAGVPQGSVLGP